MRYFFLVVFIINSFVTAANNPLNPLIKKDTITYIQCYVIDPRDNSAFAPYTFFKIGHKYYEGVAFPFRNSDCIENYIGKADSFKFNYERTIDTSGEWKVYELAQKLGLGDSYDSLKTKSFPDLWECIKTSKGMISDIFQFVEIKFTAEYYLIMCSKPRNCYGPLFICDDLADIYRTPVFTKVETILE